MLDINKEPYSVLLRLADKGKPDLYNIIKRSYAYKHDAVEVLNHMYDKFGRNGYIACNDKLYCNIYERELSKLYEEIDELTIDKIKTIVGENNG